MKELLASATLRKDNYINYGFIHIKGDLIEGIFTNDYLRIFLTGEKIILHLTEKQLIEYEENLFRYVTVESIFQKEKYPYHYLYTPDKYTLIDETGHILNLSLEEKLDSKSKKASQVLKELESIRF